MNLASASISTTPDLHAVRPGSLAAWSIATRPKTWWIATMPVLVGSSLAFAESGTFNGGVAALALLASVVIQAISNLQNDVGYTARGIESHRRVGLPRATANGLLAPAQVRWAIRILMLAAVILGLPLVQHGGWPVLAMGIASIVGAVSYMGGPRPIAFTPFGELTVLVFFGLVAVGGSAYLQVGHVPDSAWIAALAIGMHAAAVLAVNNQRDSEHDRASGRRTFVVVYGERTARAVYAALVVTPFALALVVALLIQSAWLALPMLVAARSAALTRDFATMPPGIVWNALMFRTVKLEVAFGVLLSAGAIIAGIAA